MKISNTETLNVYNNFVMFRTTCNCSSDEHSITVTVEKDKYDFLTISLFFKTIWSNVYEKNIFKKILGRFSAAVKLLFTGYLQLEDEFLFRDKTHLKDFKFALDEAIKHVEENGGNT